MGACCTTHIKYQGRHRADDDLAEKEGKGHQQVLPTPGHNGAIVRLQGSSSFISMYTRKGKKGINQDAMTVWENFMGEKKSFFCGVFDGHGPFGHKVSRHVRDTLPFKLSSIIKTSQPNGCTENDAAASAGQSYGKNDSNGVNEDRFSSWEASLIRAFKESDEELNSGLSFNSYNSGSTAVTIVKQDEHLIISNLGDSRAILCTRGNKNRLIPIQLTVDLKPRLPDEAERIEKCGGRVFAMDEEPHVLRVWAPDQDSPGLAMTRAFGDFCLKDYGLSSIPEVSYRRLTNNDEFVVLATDGVWDVLTNKEVITIVASVKKQSTAAKVLVYYAVQAWKSRYPGSQVDDCAVICLFLKEQPLVSKSVYDQDHNHNHDYDMSKCGGSQLDFADSNICGDKKAEEGETVINCDFTMDKSIEQRD
ncbi:hypothetical protein F383_23069 [Gossypium arboreum]|uniref:Uncharacterized protein n=2 Tax=Gossypium arboreum TaxID=29729 RepID=A0A0B0P1F2_GOSAR|nr:probable protein phosphatase 2C 65 [Gossypium arboreum]KAK5804402.1 hypothetical protein PVK06_032051 [Gossypium arboreum]KHG17181.1 hypothetical protein F383_23069 [Gossypium arboreum]